MLGRNKILNSQHLIDAILVMVQDLNQVKAQAHVLCAVVTDRFVLARDFLLYSKLALNVPALANK